MADLSYSTLPVQGDTNDATDVITPLNEVKDYVNGSGWVNSARLAAGSVSTAKIADDAVTGAKLDATAVGDSDQGDELGVNGASTVRRGKSIIATEESTASTSYTYLTTPDRVQNVVLPTDGLIFVMYHASWKSSLGTVTAQITLDGNAVKTAKGTSAPPYDIPATNNLTSFTCLRSGATGLIADRDVTPGGYTGDVATGQTIGSAWEKDHLAQDMSPGQDVDIDYYIEHPGGVCAIFAAAGTYDVGVQFFTGGSTVTVKERKLWVWTMGF